MKNKFVIITLFVISLFGTIAYGEDKSVKYIPEKPLPGSEIKVIYNAEKTPLEKAEKIEIIYYLYSQNSGNLYHIEDARSVEMKKEGNNWSASISTLPSTDIGLIVFKNGIITDNNNDNGYFVKLYSNEGIELTKSQIGNAWGFVTWAANLRLVKRDLQKAAVIIKNIFTSEPQLCDKYISQYMWLQAVTLKDDTKQKLTDDLERIEKRNDLNEESISMIIECYDKLKMDEKVNEITQMAIQRFPKSSVSYKEKVKYLTAESNIQKKIELVKKLEAEFAGTSYSGEQSIRLFKQILDSNESELLQSWVNYLISNGIINLQNYNGYLGLLNDKKNNPELALKIAEIGIKGWKEENVNPKLVKPSIFTQKMFDQLNKNGYSYARVQYAKTLSFCGRNDEALREFEDILSNKNESELAQSDALAYLNCLPANRKYETAKPLIEGYYKSGFVMDQLASLLKEIYIKNNGSTAGYEEYISGLKSIAKSKKIDQIKESMINIPAPQFTLTDLDGKTVSLADLKGKIVIIDFWATWCGPCKASFPGMQKALNKYRDNVAFIFVDTGEQVNDKITNAKKFLADNKYSFHVVIDEMNKTAASYKVSGIPTKCILDKEGNIRFKVSGFSGNADEMVEEIGVMIDLAAK